MRNSIVARLLGCWTVLLITKALAPSALDTTFGVVAYLLFCFAMFASLEVGAHSQPNKSGDHKNGAKDR